MATVGIWRASAPLVQKGQFFTFFEKKESLKKAIKASDGKSFLFTEKGAGVCPLVIIGTPLQILIEVANQADMDSQINNQIEDLPVIFYGISPYVEKGPYKALTPLHDFMGRFLTEITGFLPSGNIADTVGRSLKFFEVLKNLTVGHQGADSNFMELKFSYIKEPGMIELKSGGIKFKEILEFLRKNIPLN